MKSTILKWFDLLNIPSQWRDEVAMAADSFDKTDIEKEDDPFAYLAKHENKMLTLLYSLYRCEEFFETAKKRDIPDDILFATLTEVRRYTIEYNNMTKGEKLGIYVGNWVGKILRGEIYRLGRLEFEMRTCPRSSEKHGIEVGDNVIGVHIPDNGGPFTPEACNEAYKLSEEFFAKYFPEYQYKCYVCSSWLLDKTLKQFLSPDSNIVKFMDSFDIDEKTTEAYSSLTFLFGRGTEIKDLYHITPTTSLQKKVIDHLLNGGKLYSGYGFKERP